jgi:hypothetical protein
MPQVNRFTPLLHILGIAFLLATMVLMAALPVEAGGQGPWVMLALNNGGTQNGQDIPGALYTIDAATNTLYGPFLQGQLGSANGGLFDVTIAPGSRRAIVSNFGDRTVFLVNCNDPTNLQLINSQNITFFAEDTDITADGRFALVADGGFSSKLASINMATGTLVEVQNLGSMNACAVSVAPDGTIVMVDYFGSKINTATIDSSGDITPGQSYDIPTETKDGTVIKPLPVNVAIAPDGQTVLVLTTSSDFVTVYKITGPGTLTYMGRVFGLPAIWNDTDPNDKHWSGSQQSAAFNSAGTQAYVITNGRGFMPDKTELPSQISVLDINGPGNVSLRIASAADIPHIGSSQLFGVDCLAVANNNLYVGNPTISGASPDLRVVNLTSYSVSAIPVGLLPGAVPAGVDSSIWPPLQGVGGEVAGVNKLGVLIPWLALVSILITSGSVLMLSRRKRTQS